MPPPPTTFPEALSPMRGMGTTKHMIVSDVHKEPGTVLTPAVQILAR
jgi:hypothetical protein